MIEKTPILSCEGLSKKYGDFLALNDIHLNFLAGRLYGVIGPNGAGKSTFFNILAGSQQASRGSIKFFEKDICKIYFLANKQ